MSKPSDDTPDGVEAPRFEAALGRLEAIVHDLEDGDIGLDAALAQYEAGIRLLRQCYGLLERAERRIELLSGVDAEGNPVTQPFDDVASTADEKSGRPRRRAQPARSVSDRPEGTPPDGRGIPPPTSEIDSPPGLF